MPLYGQELSLTIDPLEAGLGFGVDLSQEGTAGIPALLARKQAGIAREAVSLAVEKGRVPRPGFPVLKDGEIVGVVTSGGVSPTVGKNIARALVPSGLVGLGDALDVEIRGKPQPMTVVAHPFYKRPRG